MRGTKATAVALGVGLGLAVVLLAAECLRRWRLQRTCLTLNPGRVL